MGRVQVTTLPGVGVMRTFMTAADDWIGVLELRSGARQLFVDDPSDPDTRRLVAELQTDDCQLLTELLGADVDTPVPQETIDELVDWVLVAPHSPGQGQTIGQLGLRSRTGATIVAVLRDRMHTEVAPNFLIRDGDILVLSGGPEALDQARYLLTDEVDGSSGHETRHRET